MPKLKLSCDDQVMINNLKFGVITLVEFNKHKSYNLRIIFIKYLCLTFISMHAIDYKNNNNDEHRKMLKVNAE